MSYERMWDEEPPTPEERLEAQIKAAGGVIVRAITDVPPGEHWAIIRYGLFRHEKVVYVAYSSKELWLNEVKRIATTGEVVTAISARSASAKVTVSVDVSVDAP